MARPRKDKAEAKETTAEIADKLIKEVDPEVLLAGMLGATAAAGGLTPPLTRILMAIGENGSGLADDYKTLLIAGTGIGPVWATLMHLLSPKDSSGPPPTNLAIAASGALEAMLMMSLAKNPDLIKAVIDAMPKTIALPI